MSPDVISGARGPSRSVGGRGKNPNAAYDRENEDIRLRSNQDLPHGRAVQRIGTSQFSIRLC